MASSTIVLMTGANSGIGYAASKVLASASASYHVIMAGRSKQKIDDAVAALKSTAGVQGSVSPLVMDVTDQTSIADAVKEVSSQFGRLDVLVNNAGITSKNPDPKENLAEILLCNTIGPVLVTEAFTELLIKSKTPVLIHVSSGLGSIGMATTPGGPYNAARYTNYRMSKAALNMYAAQNVVALKEHNVKVFPMCPGLVRSNLRGTSEAEVSAAGNAGDPEVSGKLMLDIIEGRRDADMGKFVHKAGVYDW